MLRIMRGDDETRNLTIYTKTGSERVPYNLSGASAFVQIRQGQKVIFTVPVAVTDSAAGKGTFTLPNSLTSRLPDRGISWAIRTVDSQGRVKTALQGAVEIL